MSDLCRASIAERQHDEANSARPDESPYLAAALDELIDRLFGGKKVGRYYLNAYVESFADQIAACFVVGDTASEIRGRLESLIRAELADSDEVRELAAEFAEERP